MRACLVCGTTFEIPTDRRIRKKCCSTQCLNRLYYIEHGPRRKKKCLGCDSMSVRYDSDYCSLNCYRRASRTHKALVHVPWDQVRPKVRAQAKPKRQTTMRTFFAGRCPHCGDTFVAIKQGYPTIYCSIMCGRRAAGRRRKALKRKAFVENVYRFKVFERDNYICQLCMKLCRTDVDVQHMQAPTIDHVIALANGGEHSMSNVQTAHRLCNSIKSDRLVYSFEGAA